MQRSHLSKPPRKKDLALAGLLWVQISPPNRSQEALTQEEAYHYQLRHDKPGVDAEARWVRKGKHYRYGYKKHVLTDKQGLVETLITTPANQSDTAVFPDLIEKSELSLG